MEETRALTISPLRSTSALLERSSSPGHNSTIPVAIAIAIATVRPVSTGCADVRCPA